MVKVLLVGNGGREHAIAEALVNGGAELSAYMAKKNPGITRLCNDRIKIGTLNDFKDVIAFGKDNHVEYAIIGPEAPLADGITNALQAAEIPTVGPTIECAQLESSKIFTRNLLNKYKIASNIQFQTFKSMEGINNYIHEIGIENVVVKPDGLTGGKGVKVWGDHLHQEADIYQYCEEIFSKKGHVIIEEKLDGEEFTYQCFVDGKHVVGSPIVQDNKRAFVEDKGPNTGGMGSVSMVDHLMPFLKQADIDYAREQVLQSINAIAKETGQEYKGILYGQFMKTAKGIKLIEYNIRFGDPEAMNVLPLLKSNFVVICEKILDGHLDNAVDFERKASVCKYLVPDGYPDNPKNHAEIIIDQVNLKKNGIKCYYAAVSEENSKIFTTSSRTIGILGIADTLEEAEKKAELGTKFVQGPLFHRADIGTRALIEKRLKHINSLLSKEKKSNVQK